MVSNKYLNTVVRDGYTVLDMGDMEIWDGADLALIRETFSRLKDGKNCRAIGVDMAAVKYIPSGFFGLLFDWYDRGVAIRLYNPKEHVRAMLWFRRFFIDAAENRHDLAADKPLSEAGYPMTYATVDANKHTPAGKGTSTPSNGSNRLTQPGLASEELAPEKPAVSKQ